MAVAINNLANHQSFTFDVWNTLIKANLEFSRLRTHEIAKFYAITFDEAKEAYTSVKHFLDQSAEIAGICMSTPQCWRLLDSTINRLRRKQGLIMVDVGVEQLASNCNKMFVENPPIFTDETKQVLKNLKASGKKLGIISNTNFIPGHLLYNELFKELDVFDSVLFSDDFGHAKPDFRTFESVRYMLQREDDLDGQPTIVHIGDNLICDAGAIRAGYNFQPVDNPANLVEIFNSVGI